MRKKIKEGLFVNHSLAVLLEEILPVADLPDIKIKNLKLDSRKVAAGDLFFAYPGSQIDSRKFIPQVLAQGAQVVLSDTAANKITIEYKDNIPIIHVPNLCHYISHIAARFYENPAQQLKVIAVTGTNGKTSTTYFLAQALQRLGHKAGIIGTLGHGLIDNLTPQNLTTPDPILIQAILADLLHQGVEYVIMEASSHALVQERIAGIAFIMGIFTNLTQDHLDYHGDMENYAKAKRLLFTMPSLKQALFNLDDPVGQKWFKEFQHSLAVFGYSLKEQIDKNARVIYTKDLQLHANGIEALIIRGEQQGYFKSNLLGRFNMANLLAVMGALLALDYSFQEVLAVMAELRPVPGRMQLLGGGEFPLVVIDYAHTPDALEQALKVIREHCTGKLFCVFGCGGNRDRGKRPLMGKIAEQYADKVILTNDNVRFEDAEKIITDILAGFDYPDKVLVESNRAAAIKLALDNAKKGDIVLLAGKGHENYEIVGDQYLPFNEAEIVLKRFEDRVK